MNNERPNKLTKFKPLAWPVAIGFSIFTICLTILIFSGALPIEKIIVDNQGVTALFGKGENEAWKKKLAASLKQSVGENTLDVGMFLYLNQKVYIDGRDARNIGEICVAIQNAALGSTDNIQEKCPPESFANIRFSLEELNDYGLVTEVRYANSKGTSYRLNALGQQAFSGLRQEWVESGTNSAIKLTHLDLSYSDMRDLMVNGRQWYEAKYMQRRN